jgi:hypothetical protein
VRIQQPDRARQRDIRRAQDQHLAPNARNLSFAAARDDTRDPINGQRDVVRQHLDLQSAQNPGFSVRIADSVGL